MLNLFPNWLALPAGMAFGLTMVFIVRSFMHDRALPKETEKFWGE